MKLRDLKIGGLVLTPKMFLTLLGALFILGLEIGTTVALIGYSLFALFCCSIISIFIVVNTFSRAK